MAKISIKELEITEKGATVEFIVPVPTRSIPKDKLEKRDGLEKNEKERTICSGIYLGKTPQGEHELLGKKQGNGRHLYHFFIKT